ncbi:MAG: dicarboxylate/amino acid:cation symporter [Spirochaetaceae bacterium]|jgi:Na+/H+-dicarboxylate symporter|nr:dicarboxylate/amino acid:cation symporter [Spirochaetaceae bacterium]
MKIWVKLVIGSVLGMFLGFLLPESHPAIPKILTFLKDLAIGAGRYTAMPIIVFSLTIGIYELRQDGKFWPLLLKSAAVLVLAPTLVIGLGIGATLLFPPGRIPVLIERQTEEIFFSPAQNALDVFPTNMFFVNDGVYLFPLCVFAFFLALGLCFDRNRAKQAVTLVDSLSRIFYHIASFFSEILGLLIIALSAYWATNYKEAADAGAFASIARMLMIYALVLTLLVLPVTLFLLKGTKNPWKALYGVLGPAIGAFFSGDYNFSIPVLATHLKENLGIRRRSASVTVALFSVFGRSGSAMTACVAFIVIIQSYSSLSISLGSVISIGLTAFFLSFLLARNSADAAFTALAVLCARYGRGIEASFLILKPLAFYLISIGAFIDIVIAALGSFALARMSGFQEDRPAGRYI